MIIQLLCGRGHLGNLALQVIVDVQGGVLVLLVERFPLFCRKSKRSGLTSSELAS